METTNGHIKQLDTINSKILETARSVASPPLSSLELFVLYIGAKQFHNLLKTVTILVNN